MSLIRFENIYKSFPGKVVLDNVNFQVDQGEHIALVGRNGCGKTTLFQLIANRLEPDRGIIERQRNTRISYLEQIPSFPPNLTLLEIAETSFNELKEVEKQLKILETKISQGQTELLNEYAKLQSFYHLHGGYHYPSLIKKILTGLGFTHENWGQKFHELSGGQQTRLLLALSLLQDADVLLLDEPDNYLDIEGKEWLEDFLISSNKTIILISHDQRLLSKFPTRILELENGKITSYPGSYEEYRNAKEEVYLKQQELYERQEKELRKQEEWIERFRYKKTRARQVQSRIKQLSKTTLVNEPKKVDPKINFQIQSNKQSGHLIIHAENLSMQYGDKVLYNNVTFQLYRNERMGIIGPNGSGKTTLIKHILGKHKGTGGTIRFGHNVKIGYYDQHHHNLNPENEVIQEVQHIAPEILASSLRTFLGAFLFHGDDVFKKVKTLSGGEQSRLALAKLILQKPNVLLLDEPTNHMDLASREALENALQVFDGSIILVTHDRELLDQIVDRLIVLKENKTEVVWGNYSHYLWREKNVTVTESTPTHNRKSRTDKIELIEEAKKEKREQRKKERRRAELEKQIEILENEIEELEMSFSNVDPKNFQRIKELNQDLKIKKELLNSLYNEWETLIE
ncbi:MAG: ATP-binding cassette domain-containing protein [Candidatus Hydrogenedens sp.]|nr:ATP-binding cassette domain-containing protein [Candidatus Hydrogenedens sp.]